jgi:ACS family D-galactonate transporter-like MFS transporter
MNFVNTLFGLAAPIVTGFLVQATGSFAPAFLVAGVIMLAGIFFYTVVLGRIEQIPAPPGVA